MTVRPFRFGVVTAQAPSGEAWLAKVRRAEALGVSTILVPDRLMFTISPLPALAAAAGATRSIRLGTFVLATGWRNPALLAAECAAIDFLSGGRFEPGFGAGLAADDARRAGLPTDPPGVRIAKLAETLAIVKTLLNGEEAHVTGAHYAVAGARVYPPPVQKPRPPVLVAGSGKRLLSLAAKEADIVAVGVRPDENEAGIAEKIGWVRDAAGDRFSAIELSIGLVAVMGDAPPAPGVRERLRGLFGVELDDLVQRRSPLVPVGTPDEMSAHILGLRERFGISYVTLADDLMEPFAPVIERLAGR